MANALKPYHSKLPVVTQEIGDTWIYGCASDPLKVARYREVARLREKWIAQGAFQVGDATDLQLLRHVLLEPEHTWGIAANHWLDLDNYEPAGLARMLDTKNYKVVEFSWIEKRQDLTGWRGDVAGGSARREAQDRDRKPDADQARSRRQRPLRIRRENRSKLSIFILGIDAKTGAITRLRNKATGREWASERNPIALLTYQTLSQEDYHALPGKLSGDETADWALLDFGKPDIERFGARARRMAADQRRRQQVEETARSAPHPDASAQFKDDEASGSGRAAFPRDRLSSSCYCPRLSPRLHLSLSWFGKPATRLPEALWLTFNPIAADQKGWTLDKSGEWISPFDVAPSGNRHMHAVQQGFRYESGDDSFTVDTLDAPVVALGERNPLIFSNDQPDLAKGIHSCLFNNAWGTNYIMWYGEDVLARYVIRA